MTDDSATTKKRRTQRASSGEPDQPEAATSETAADEDPLLLDPTEQEIEAWAARERERRKAWLAGPTSEERASWARRERARRLSEVEPEVRAAELARRGRRYGREAMLATEGAVSLFSRWTRRAMTELVRAGLDWEDEVGRTPRRRIRLDDEDR